MLDPRERMIISKVVSELTQVIYI